MRKSSTKRRLIILGAVAALGLIVPGVAWLSLTHKPSFYRTMTELPSAQREARAKHFVASSLQLRNDITNERDWQAVFTDQEVNAWLAEDFVVHFADQIPSQVHEPRVAFEADRVTLAFQLDRGPIRTVIWVVARVRVPEDNVLALTLEKIRAGVIPISADPVIGPITERAREHGLEVTWGKDKDGDNPVALVRFHPEATRSDVILESLAIRHGQIRLAGRSDRLHGASIAPSLPTRRVLQLNFPRRNTQPRRPAAPALRNSTNPTT